MVQVEIKKKKKRWIPILPTNHFKILDIGETYTAEPSKLVGKTLSLNLMELTRDPKKQNSKITFKIIEVKDNKALTEIKRYEMLPSLVKRLAHPGKSKIDISLRLETKDNIKIKIKPVIVTKSRTTRSKLSKLRKQTEDFLKLAVKNLSYSDLISSLLSFKLQILLKQNLKKTYPITVCHIRIMEKE